MPRVPHPANPALPHSDDGVFRVGDRVCYGAASGRVVGTISAGDYASPANQHTWQELGAGVLVRWDDGLFGHFREPDANLLRARSPELGVPPETGPPVRHATGRPALRAVR